MAAKCWGSIFKTAVNPSLGAAAAPSMAPTLLKIDPQHFAFALQPNTSEPKKLLIGIEAKIEGIVPGAGFWERRKQDVCAAAPRDGFTAVPKTCTRCYTATALR